MPEGRVPPWIVTSLEVKVKDKKGTSAVNGVFPYEPIREISFMGVVQHRPDVRRTKDRPERTYAAEWSG